MANGDDERDLVPEERRYGGARVVPPRRFPPGYTGIPAGEAPPLPSGETLPSTQGYQPDIPRSPMTLNEQIEQRKAVLKGKLGGPGPEATGWQRFRHGLNVVGQDIGMAVRPDIVQNIPGTIPNMRRELEDLTKLQSEEQEREAQAERGKELTGIEREKAEAEIQRSRLPHPLAGEENVHTLSSGQRNRVWEWPGLGTAEVPEGTPAPVEFPGERTMPTTTGAPAAPPPGPPEGPLPRAQAPAAPPPLAAPPVAAAAQGYWGKPTKPTTEEEREKFLTIAQKADNARTPEEQNFFQAHLGEFGGVMPMSAAEQKTYNDDLNSSYADARKGLGNDAPKPQLITEKDNHDIAEKKKADYSDKIFKAIQLKGTKDLQTQMLQGKLEDEARKRETEADQGFVNLYSQQNYARAIDQWHKSGNFATDSGLITEQLAKQGHKDFGVGGIGSALGVLAANPWVGGAVVGADALLNAAGGTISGYLDTLKKAGISAQGYEAMQAYYNAMIGRMLYEVATLKLPATALRSSTMVEKILGSVPPPNTPPDAFKNAFDQYYKPMETMTQRRGVPKGYTPPRYEQIYPPAPPAAGGAAAPGAAPGGAKPVWNPQTRKYETRELTTPQ